MHIVVVTHVYKYVAIEIRSKAGTERNQLVQATAKVIEWRVHFIYLYNCQFINAFNY